MSTERRKTSSKELVTVQVSGLDPGAGLEWRSVAELKRSTQEGKFSAILRKQVLELDIEVIHTIFYSNTTKRDLIKVSKFKKQWYIHVPKGKLCTKASLKYQWIFFNFVINVNKYITFWNQDYIWQQQKDITRNLLHNNVAIEMNKISRFTSFSDYYIFCGILTWLYHQTGLSKDDSIVGYKHNLTQINISVGV